MTPLWVVMQTKPCAEEVAERSLRQAGYRTYLPRYRRRLQPHGWQRDYATSMRPLFPSMLFVHDWIGWPRLPLQGTIGLLRGLSGGESAKIADADVGLIMVRELGGEYDDVAYPAGVKTLQRSDLKPGDVVSFEHGAVARFTATLEALSDNGRAIVNAMIMGRLVRMTVDQDGLALAVG